MKQTFKVGEKVEVSLGAPVNYQVSVVYGHILEPISERGYYCVATTPYHYMVAHETMIKRV